MRRTLACVVLALTSPPAFAVDWPSMPRMVGQRARVQLQRDPTNLGAHARLAVALAAQGACAESMEHLAVVREARPLGPTGLVAVATCAAAQGRPSDGLAALEEAAVISPGDPGVALRLGRARLHEGDRLGVLAVLDQLGDEERVQVTAWLLRSELRLVEGDPQLEDDIAMVEWDVPGLGGGGRAAVSALEARWWLRQGHPRVAAELLRETAGSALRNRQIARLQAEAWRRAGNPGRAAAIFERRLLLRDEDVALVAVRACIALDLGDRQAAASLLSAASASSPGAADVPAVLAARWYLARGTDGAAALRRQYEALPGGLSALDLMVPVRP
jgi:hypothetical protein